MLVKYNIKDFLFRFAWRSTHIICAKYMYFLNAFYIFLIIISSERYKQPSTQFRQ